jgi:hypothetical protein
MWVAIVQKRVDYLKFCFYEKAVRLLVLLDEGYSDIVSLRNNL